MVLAKAGELCRLEPWSREGMDTVTRPMLGHTMDTQWSEIVYTERDWITERWNP